MMRILFFALAAVMPAITYAGVGDTYVCKEKEINIAGYKDEFILFWHATDYEMRYKQVKGSVGGTFKRDFYTHNANYFTSVSYYQNGQILATFDGTTFIQVYVEAGYTGVGDYTCAEF